MKCIVGVFWLDIVGVLPKNILTNSLQCDKPTWCIKCNIVPTWSMYVPSTILTFLYHNAIPVCSINPIDPPSGVNNKQVGRVYSLLRIADSKLNLYYPLSPLRLYVSLVCHCPHTKQHSPHSTVS